MDQKQYFKQMLDFSKTAFDQAFNAIISVQDQMEAISDKILEQAAWMPEEGKKAITEWIKACKKGRDDFKKAVEDNFKRVEEFFSSSN